VAVQVKEALRHILGRAVVATGLTYLGRRLSNRAGTMIVYGHRISGDDEGYLQGLDPIWFEAQLRYLTRHYEVITLAQLVECLERKTAPPPKSVVITLDDGFRDNFEWGLPTLERMGVRATIFVVTQSLTDGRLPWSQRLGFAFQHTAAATLQHPSLGPDPMALPDEGSRRTAYLRVKRSLVAEPREHRDAQIDAIVHALGVEPPEDRMMTWEQARSALACGHDIAAHTYSHALLAHVDPREARTEMLRSKSDLQQRLGINRPDFCFPGGSTNATLRALARELGFRSTFRPDAKQRLNRSPETDPFSMVRIGLPNGPAYQLEAELDGPYHLIRRLTGRYG
jgi:peptidoglycan/xylan/chitin deacetylase (PgdA/CDA1 family)